ncbi:MAG: hypothetical protein FD180_3343 [Planctomycetota bacterium]|nr:MAG: hypothetical protein FD180_3343 [Planctomycetota bacterium]
MRGKKRPTGPFSDEVPVLRGNDEEAKLREIRRMRATGRSGIVPALVDAIPYARPESRRAILEALGDFGRLDAIDALGSDLNSIQPDVRKVAASSLARIGAVEGPIPEEARTLERLWSVASTDRAPALDAIAGMVRRARDRATAPQRIKLLPHPHEALRRAAAFSLAETGWKPVDAQDRERVRAVSREYAQNRIADALRPDGPPRGVLEPAQEAADESGAAMMIAAAAADEGMVRFLGSAGVSACWKDRAGSTALHRHLERAAPDVATLLALLAAGADLTAKDSRGDTALDLLKRTSLASDARLPAAALAALRSPVAHDRFADHSPPRNSPPRTSRGATAPARTSAGRN